MKLSIIIVSFNTASLLEKCIKSIYQYPPQVKFEIIVVDNNSQDDSLKKLESLKKKHSNLHLIQNKDNVGFAKANNQGIEKAKGEYILLLNSDTQVKKNSIQTLYDFAEKTSDTGAVASQLLNPDGSIQESVFLFPTLLRYIRHYWLGEKNLLNKYAPKVKNPVQVEVAVAASMLLTPVALKKVGKLNDKYFMYFEDFDYCKRIWQEGLVVYYHPQSQVVHEHGASGKNDADSANQWKRMIPSAKIYYGLVGYYLRWFISRSSQILGITK